MSDEKATLLEDVLIDLLMNGQDRGALVRHAQGDECVAVCVFMITQSAAWSTLGEALKPLVFEVSGETNMFYRTRANVRLSEFFGEADRHGRVFCYGDVWIGPTEFSSVLFRGAEVCARAAAICNTHGCPCSLEPGKNPDGYTVTRRVER